MEDQETSMLQIMNDFTADKALPLTPIARNVIVPSSSQHNHRNLMDGFMLGESFTFFETTKPYWISNVEFLTEKPGADVRLKIIDADGKEYTTLPSARSAYLPSEVVEFQVDRAAIMVSLINGDEEPFRLRRLKIEGRSIDELVKLMKKARKSWKNLNEHYDALREQVAPELAHEKSEVETLKKESADLQDKLVQLKQALAVDEKQATTVSNYLHDMEAKHTNLSEQVNQLLNERTSLSSSNTKLKNEIAEKQSQRESVSETLSETIEKLKQYKSDASLYSEDFSEYKSEINRQNSIYRAVLFFLLIAGTVISVNMYIGASKLTSDLQFNFDIWSLLASRLPIISLNIFLLGICSTVVYKMLDLITKNNERLSQTKQIAYLVKECTDSQSEDLTLDDEQILKNRISNKMVLIKEFVNSQKESNFKRNKSTNFDDHFRELKELLSKSSS